VRGSVPEQVDALELLVVELEPRGAEPAACAVLDAAALDRAQQLMAGDPEQPGDRRRLAGPEALRGRERGDEGLGGQVDREVG
jgi:hypothetical protein